MENRKREKKIFGIVSFIAIVAILLMLLQGGVNFGDLAGFAIKTASSKTIKSCTDSDSGPDITVLGTTTGPETKRDTAVTTEGDYCKDSETIVEYICENGLVKEQEYSDDAADRDYRISCECEEGVCTNMYKIQKTPTKITDVEFKPREEIGQRQSYQYTICVDTDDGRDYYEKGTISIREASEVSYTDYCCSEGEDCATYTDTGRLKEYYCTEEQQITQIYPECPSGYSCSDGACV